MHADASPQTGEVVAVKKIRVVDAKEVSYGRMHVDLDKALEDERHVPCL